jgi:hypothetical protein
MVRALIKKIAALRIDQPPKFAELYQHYVRLVLPVGWQNDPLQGRPGDWLLRYADGSHSVVRGSNLSRKLRPRPARNPLAAAVGLAGLTIVPILDGGDVKRNDQARTAGISRLILFGLWHGHVCGHEQIAPDRVALSLHACQQGIAGFHTRRRPRQKPPAPEPASCIRAGRADQPLGPAGRSCRENIALAPNQTMPGEVLLSHRVRRLKGETAQLWPGLLRS